MRSNEQGRAAQVIAWAWIVMLHAGLFWLLSLHQRNSSDHTDASRMRLVFVEPITRPRPPPLPPSAARPALRTRPALPDRSRVAATPAPDPPVAPFASTAELLEHGREWALQQTPAPSFADDPLRSRQARLPGGDAPGTFRMREPLSPARVVGFIGKAFGDPGPPCPRIRTRLHGLLSATSDRERELLTEELRRDREYCRP